MKTLIILLLLPLICFADDNDAALAEALATAGAVHAAKGRYEQAQDALYRALIHDASCGLAYFELGRLAEKDGDKAAAATLYARALATGRDGARADAAKALARVNPFASKIEAELSAYASDVDKLIVKYPNVTCDAVTTLARLGLALPSGKKFFRGEPMARVAFYETMGYEIGEFGSNAKSHVGHEMKYNHIPDELSGLQYTLIVPGKTSPLRVRFKSDGVLIVLANKTFKREHVQQLERLGKRAGLGEITTDFSEHYDVFQISGKSGDTLSLIFYVLVAGSLEKDKK